MSTAVPSPPPASSAGPAEGRPLRVLAFPRDRFRATQPYHALLADALTAEGVSVHEYTPARAFLGRYDILHLHHPEKFVTARASSRDLLRFAIFFASVAAQRMRGAGVVWTAHNEGPHEPGHPMLDRLFWRLFPPALDGVIHLSESSRAALPRQRPWLGRLPSFVVAHGDFRAAYRNDLGREAARRRLGYAPRDRVVAFIGNVRAYKNVPRLVACAAALPDPDLRLLVAGRIHTPELAAEIAAAAGDDSRIRVVDAFVAEDDMQLYLNAADLVVLPFRRILNSGSAILALSFDRPVLVPDQGSLRELGALVGADWVRLYDGDLTPEILADAAGDFLGGRRARHAPLDRLAWPELARATMQAYRAVSASHAPAASASASRTTA